MNKPEKLILDYSKWRCGEDGPNKLGEGIVALKNDEGFMCCLGMWSLQLGASEDEILNKGEPNEIGTLIPLFTEIDDDARLSTNLSCICIGINDREETTPDEKISELKTALGIEGIQLEVINKP